MPAIRGAQSKKKTRRYTRDLDQIHSDLHIPGHLHAHKSTKAEEDLPGLGQHYCTECAKWFDQESNLLGHLKSKVHKKRVKQLKEEPYTQKEAEASVGLWTDNGRRGTDAMVVEEEEGNGMGEQDAGAAIV